MTSDTRSLARIALFLLCVAGATISAGMVQAHAGPWPGTTQSSGLLAHLCGTEPGAASGCAAVVKSDWSAFDVSIPMITSTFSVTWQRIVIPVAFVGLAYFIALGTWFGFAGHPATWGRWRLAPMLVVAVGFIGSVVLMGILVTKLDGLCGLCLATHAINGLLAIGTLLLCCRGQHAVHAATNATHTMDTKGHRGDILSGGSVLRIGGFTVCLIVGLWMYRGAKLETRHQVTKLLPYKEFVDERSKDPAFLVREFYAQPQHTIEEAGRFGHCPPAGDVPTLTVFTDFQCPACACFAHKWRAEYLPQWTGAIHIDIRHYPLSSWCNDQVKSDLHPAACDAAYAAEAARLQGGDAAFAAIYDRLFESMGRLDAGSYAAQATDLGLDSDQLLADMGVSPVREAVARDVALAKSLGVRQTPAVFLNGRRVPAICLHNPLFWEAISDELWRDLDAVAADDRSATAVPGRQCASGGVSVIQP